MGKIMNCEDYRKIVKWDDGTPLKDSSTKKKWNAQE